MMDLGRNPEDRFSHNEAHMWKRPPIDIMNRVMRKLQLISAVVFAM